jgi:hypothetical protein
MADAYADGTPCIIKVLTPKGEGWREVPFDNRMVFGFPARAFIHKSNLSVISAVEVASEPGMDKGFEYQHQHQQTIA